MTGGGCPAHKLGGGGGEGKEEGALGCTEGPPPGPSSQRLPSEQSCQGTSLYLTRGPRGTDCTTVSLAVDFSHQVTKESRSYVLILVHLNLRFPLRLGKKFRFITCPCVADETSTHRHTETHTLGRHSFVCVCQIRLINHDVPAFPAFVTSVSPDSKRDEMKFPSVL